MKLIDHDNVTVTEVELEPAPDGTMNHILVVHTNLPLMDVEPNFDESKVTELVKTVQAYMRDHTNFNRARIKHRT